MCGGLFPGNGVILYGLLPTGDTARKQPRSCRWSILVQNELQVEIALEHQVVVAKSASAKTAKCSPTGRQQPARQTATIMPKHGLRRIEAAGVGANRLDSAIGDKAMSVHYALHHRS